ncbi:hypothetical protein FSP39_005553 [Pinctada imbricata]|uniref:Uncharacterized protein n=1 Tax=Pinctada imbricata TaxID=66713 RepID=A0AA89BSQ0_PINIB|nr:hypothetical protein FSP39_005553 [Pinctada imbricata]
MVREIAERPKRALIRRESTFRNTRKTPKFQRINGWDTTPVVSDSLDSKKLKLTEEDLQYKYVPKRRCTHLDDEQVFEKHSLHRSLLLREKEELSKPKRAKTSLNMAPSSTAGHYI